MNKRISEAGEMMETPRTDEHDDLASAIGGFIDELKNKNIALERELAAANARIEELKRWIRGLDQIIEVNSTSDREWYGKEIGWIYPDQTVYIGPEKPEGI